MYQPSVQPFRTPRGRPVSLWVRADTNDWNTVNACLTEDEYGLRDLHLEGWALDIGAYLGGVTVALAVDNPDLQVVAVEPVPGNVELLRYNVQLNGVDDRVTVIEGAAGDGSDVNIRYGYSGSELACHHAFVGNISLIGEPGPENPHTLVKMRTQATFGHQFSFVKIDCEGCEWDMDLTPYPIIHGEVHPVRGHDPIPDLMARLGATHEVVFDGPPAGPCGFRAVWR